MKKIKTIVILSIALLANLSLAQTPLVPDKDRQEITNGFQGLVEGVNEGNTEKVCSYLSPTNQTLQNEVRKNISGKKIEYVFDFEKADVYTVGKAVEKVTVTGNFTAKGSGWNISGLSTYFTFEKEGQRWVITNTDFHKKLGTDFIFDFVRQIGMYISIIILIIITIAGIIYYIRRKK